jgi:hypothetical protein
MVGVLNETEAGTKTVANRRTANARLTIESSLTHSFAAAGVAPLPYLPGPGAGAALPDPWTWLPLPATFVGILELAGPRWFGIPAPPPGAGAVPPSPSQAAKHPRPKNKPAIRLACIILTLMHPPRSKKMKDRNCGCWREHPILTPLAASHQPACSTEGGNQHTARLAARSDKILRKI